MTRPNLNEYATATFGCRSRTSPVRCRPCMTRFSTSGYPERRCDSRRRHSGLGVRQHARAQIHRVRRDAFLPPREFQDCRNHVWSETVLAERWSRTWRTKIPGVSTVAAHVKPRITESSP